MRAAWPHRVYAAHRDSSLQTMSTYPRKYSGLGIIRGTIAPVSVVITHNTHRLVELMSRITGLERRSNTINAPFSTASEEMIAIDPTAGVHTRQLTKLPTRIRPLGRSTIVNARVYSTNKHFRGGIGHLAIKPLCLVVE